ncbi:MAG: DUF2946 family protein [Bauldia sp.]|nr:DUF2946 family protein [Bauldia sp.]MCW5717478.1 DUF2946 family protein [Bauldia sp.]
MRPRGRGPRIWAAILAVYALLLHAPAMATMGYAGEDIRVGVSGHVHEAETHHSASEGGEEDAGHRAEDLCCVVCSGGPCAVGPVGTGSVALPLRRSPVRRRPPMRARRRLSETRRSWFEPRGPPVEA